MENQSTKNNFTIPTAIIFAGILVAGALMYNNNKSSTSDVVDTNQEGVVKLGSIDSVRPVSDDDHILGNPNASVIIVEYSDFECPFCKKFHYTMNKIMDEYGKSGKVAWVYRHFPIEKIHPIKAHSEAVASECATELGTSNTFWKFADRFFELTPSSNKTNLEIVIPKIIKELGINEQSFNECIYSGRYNKRISLDIENAIETGSEGTPWSIVIAQNGKKFQLSGAQPYIVVKQIIEIALKEK